MSLQGRVAVVTGSTSGIGLGVAEALAAEGASVMLNGFGEAGQIAALQARLGEAHGVRVGYHPADMTRPAEIAALMAAAASAFGSVDILVNNAGIQHTAPIEDFPAERWDAVIAINLSAAFHGMAAAIPMMKKTGWGRIVNIASAHGLVASAQKSAYVAAKHGLVGLTKVAAIELAQARCDVQRDLPGLGFDAAGRSADRGAGGARGPAGRARCSVICWPRSSRCTRLRRRRRSARWWCSCVRRARAR